MRILKPQIVKLKIREKAIILSPPITHIICEIGHATNNTLKIYKKIYAINFQVQNLKPITHFAVGQRYDVRLNENVNSANTN